LFLFCFFFELVGSDLFLGAVIRVAEEKKAFIFFLERKHFF